MQNRLLSTSFTPFSLPSSIFGVSLRAHLPPDILGVCMPVIWQRDVYFNTTGGASIPQSTPV